MIQLRTVCTAFLRHDDDYLLMKRSANRKIGPGFWYGVGGHVEPSEMNNPHAACLREIFEETGIPASEIEDLQEKYIVMRRGGDEIVVNHFFFGRVKTRQVTESDEGHLYWVPAGEVLDHSFFDAIRLTLVRHFEDGDRSEDVMVGIVDGEPEATIRWSPLHDMNPGGHR